MEKTIKNKWFICLSLFVLFIILLGWSHKKRIFGTESFQNNNSNWSPELLKRFQEYEKSTFDNSYQFDMQQLQKQASSEDVEYLLKTTSGRGPRKRSSNIWRQSVAVHYYKLNQAKP